MYFPSKCLAHNRPQRDHTDFQRKHVLLHAQPADTVSPSAALWSVWKAPIVVAQMCDPWQALVDLDLVHPTQFFSVSFSFKDGSGFQSASFIVLQIPHLFHFKVVLPTSSYSSRSCRRVNILSAPDLVLHSLIDTSAAAHEQYLDLLIIVAVSLLAPNRNRLCDFRSCIGATRYHSEFEARDALKSHSAMIRIQNRQYSTWTAITGDL